MPLDFEKTYLKQPSEQKTIRIELSEVAENLVVSGYTLNAAEAKIFDSTGTDKTTDMVESTLTIDAVNKYVFVTLKNGVDGSDYTLRLKTTWGKVAQPDQIDEKDLLIQVRQKGY
jgi:hypothetical protein